jgi:hypothetical protein
MCSPPNSNLLTVQFHAQPSSSWVDISLHAFSITVPCVIPQGEYPCVHDSVLLNYHFALSILKALLVQFLLRLITPYSLPLKLATYFTGHILAQNANNSRTLDARAKKQRVKMLAGTI